MAINRFTIDASVQQETGNIFDETVCGLIFDTSKRGNIFSGYSLAQAKYENEQVQRLTSMDDVVASGITEDGIMSGVPYYHLNHFFTLAKKNNAEHVIYVCFANCGSNFNVLHRVMHATKKKIFQFGIWTERDLYDYTGNDLISPVLTQLNDAIFCFKSSFQKSDEYDQEIQFNVLLCANTVRTELLNTTVYITDKDGARLKDENGNYLTVKMVPNNQTFNYRTLPPANNFDIPGLTVLIGQERSDKVHQMQARTVNGTPIGCIGAALGVLSVCPVEYFMGDNSQFSLKDVIPVAELGFGDDNTPIEKLGYVRRNEMDRFGYVFPVDREDAPGETFFSSDRTLGSKDYSSLVRCRTINKVHRIIRLALLQHTNSTPKVNPSTGKLSAAGCTAIMNDMYSYIDTYMGTGSNMNGAAQLDFRKCTVPTEQDIFKDKTLTAEVEIKPGDHSENIVLQEEVTLS